MEGGREGRGGGGGFWPEANLLKAAGILSVVIGGGGVGDGPVPSHSDIVATCGGSFEAR